MERSPLSYPLSKKGKKKKVKEKYNWLKEEVAEINENFL